jgi:hypothetical protein
MRRGVIIISGLLAVYAGWRFGMPYIDMKPEQDECSFGLVSNARYREFLSEAERRSRGEWPALTFTADEQAKQIKARIADLGETAISSSEHIAAAHAVMRQLRGHLVKSSWYSHPRVAPDMPSYSADSEKQINGWVSSYGVHSNFIGHFDPVMSETSIVLHIAGSNDWSAGAESKDERTEIKEVNVLAPSFIMLVLGLSHSIEYFRRQSIHCPF